MAELKTKKNAASVNDFINTIIDDEKKSDCLLLAQMMEELMGVAPQMWGANIVGYGSYQYEYASSSAGEWFVVGFAPRKSDITLYIIPGFAESEDLLIRLNKSSSKKCKTGKSCLYIKKLDDIHIDILRQIISQSIQKMKDKRSLI